MCWMVLSHGVPASFRVIGQRICLRFTRFTAKQNTSIENQTCLEMVYTFLCKQQRVQPLKQQQGKQRQLLSEKPREQPPEKSLMQQCEETCKVHVPTNARKASVNCIARNTKMHLGNDPIHRDISVLEKIYYLEWRDIIICKTFLLIFPDNSANIMRHFSLKLWTTCSNEFYQNTDTLNNLWYALKFGLSDLWHFQFLCALPVRHTIHNVSMSTTWAVTLSCVMSTSCVVHHSCVDMH